MVYIIIPETQLKFTIILASLKRFILDTGRSLFLTRWKHVDKENVVSVEDFMIPDLLKIQREGFGHQSSDILIRYSQKMKQTFYVIKNVDNPVGYCIYYIKPVLSLGRFNKKSVIHSIIIDRNFRHKGFGEKLLRESINEMKLNGINSILLYVNVENLPAIALYRKLGFQTIKKVKDVCGKYNTCYEMELKLVSLLVLKLLHIFFAASFFDNDLIRLTNLT